MNHREMVRSLSFDTNYGFGQWKNEILHNLRQWNACSRLWSVRLWFSFNSKLKIRFFLLHIASKLLSSGWTLTVHAEWTSFQGMKKKIETDDFPKKSEMFTYLPMCWTERCITSKKQLLIFYSTFLMSSVTKGGNRTKANIICTNKRVNIFTLLTKINKKFRHCLRS